MGNALGALFILGAFILWGNLPAARLRQRVRELEEFRLALRLLCAEIDYTATPLPRAMEYISSRLRGSGVAAFFDQVTVFLRDPQIPDASAAWHEAARAKRDRLALDKDDWPVIIRAAAGLGNLGRESQILQLRAAETQLAAHSAAAAARCEKGEKMWRYLGVLGGLAVVIILL